MGRELELELEAYAWNEALGFQQPCPVMGGEDEMIGLKTVSLNIK